MKLINYPGGERSFPANDCERDLPLFDKPRKRPDFGGGYGYAFDILSYAWIPGCTVDLQIRPRVFLQ
jgi:hypothetical protein